ncbi:hypothetical protein BV22DRAFT_1036920 [Leucogyrophana mollusca]|uniref:Uncharacterized protein n=1 Tax=Leucogyrophana mollusca TaxID=85980 RepID=A0ACB8BB61_9AGAM|nr:hypothetical protein BV22DRAFT_1036920 [Leucogyrophana mollusca]
MGYDSCVTAERGAMRIYIPPLSRTDRVNRSSIRRTLRQSRHRVMESAQHSTIRQHPQM